MKNSLPTEESLRRDPMRRFHVHVYGMMRNIHGEWYKGRQGVRICEDEFEASLYIDQCMKDPRVDRVELWEWNSEHCKYNCLRVEYVSEYYLRRGIHRPDLFFGAGRKTSYQSTLDGLGV